MDLDQPIWAALASRQAAFAVGSPRVLRMVPDVGPFGALAEPSAAAWAELAQLPQGPRNATVFFWERPVAPPPDWRVLAEFAMPQLVFDGPPPAAPDIEIADLGAAHSPAMQALVALTEPGPFGPRTHELGGYIGVLRADRLLALAGERLQFPGHTEVSAVCTHPEAVGRGYATALVSEVVRRILARGETPFLHVRHDNARALAVYERLGFRRRRELRVSVVRPPAATADSRTPPG